MIDEVFSCTPHDMRRTILSDLDRLEVKDSHTQRFAGHRQGSRYAESTVRTMMASHMCAQVQGPNIGSYDDLDRVGRGEYRLRLVQ